ncbi:MAG: biopolymer transporter ExbD [Flavobacteriales bacterium]|nr:biopolymer transporter ExbD [Flavobacteriales bacterium]MCX7649896.1 biopolymer transporter ExbD [Flavobacteriales bacterium]MDW8433071.1 biopolymer transporter ExbD [Flavobacteriales bacterium]
MAQRKKRELQEINASSMADIAFLLLVFFLVTTTFDSDYGIQRKLPEKRKDQPEVEKETKRRNAFVILVNREDRILVNGEEGDIRKLKDDVIEFILNPQNKDNLSEKKTIKSKYFGDVQVSKGVVVLQNDRGTSYKRYIEVQNVLAKAFNEMRNNLARQYFNTSYDELKYLAERADKDAMDKVDAIEEIMPLSISEAQPKNVGK